MCQPLAFLNQENYQTYSRIIAQHCESINAAIMLAELIQRHDMHLKNNELTAHEKYGDDWFYLTLDKVYDRTCLTRKQQDNAIKILKEKNLIESVVFGLPGKRYFRIKEKNVLAIFGLSKSNSTLSKKGKVGCNKRTKLDATKGQSLHIEEELQEEIYKEPTSTTSEKAAEVVHKYTEEEEESSIALKSALDKRAYGVPDMKIEAWGDKWIIPLSVFLFLMKKYGSAFVNDQVLLMIRKQKDYEKNKNNPKSKFTPVEKPENWLKKSCKENYAASESGKE